MRSITHTASSEPGVDGPLQGLNANSQGQVDGWQAVGAVPLSIPPLQPLETMDVLGIPLSPDEQLPPHVAVLDLAGRFGVNEFAKGHNVSISI